MTSRPKPATVRTAKPTTPRPDAPPRTNYTIPEVAAALRISRAQAYRMADAGELPVMRIGRRVLVPVAAYDEYVAARTEAAS